MSPLVAGLLVAFSSGLTIALAGWAVVLVIELVSARKVKHDQGR